MEDINEKQKEVAETKVCPFCRKEISIEATKCPYCQSTLITDKNAKLILMSSLGLFLISFGAFIFFISIFSAVFGINVTQYVWWLIIPFALGFIWKKQKMGQQKKIESSPSLKKIPLLIWALILLVAPIVIVGVIFLGIVIMAPAPSNRNSAPVINTPAQQKGIQVTAIQLATDYEANEIAADTKYKDQIVEVTGTIKDISKDILGAPYIILSGDPNSITDVQCTFDKSKQNQLIPLTKDTKITLLGKVSRKLLNVRVDECSIIQ
ncbi:MAG: hypothetical protein ACD_81C00219G0004 [uncultured bacterium]|uniref:tRNA_anti-like n=2 Tax=Candidatus Wolfeibacteriota TaxID=1752735 RepID=A0A0G1K781_9BACT|nr:MAG: hypothetical protein ACD_81C00219G0004 [uncultured bacterium]KKR12773.1 MAG: hypothetical protein UT41_C0001G0317 [Candidatus Wolfebacteria bacterium GW2011_GWC2_39_22]KKT43704.1 MAG: hypothetical protein UW32_C0001G0296 [Candidatus Wolfebacteria bacterium GW2011_GWE2_44_13]HBI25565.1 hypothetical protein [Candidatus Wolfebacteria bacterium]